MTSSTRDKSDWEQIGNRKVLTLDDSAYTQTLGVGRPPKPKHLRKSQSYLLRLTAGELAELETAARQLNESVAQILRKGALLYIQRGKGGSQRKEKKQ